MFLSYYLSIYANNKIKKKKCDHIKTFNLIPLQITFNHVDPYDDEYNCFEFEIIKDPAYNNNDEKADYDQPEILLR